MWIFFYIVFQKGIAFLYSVIPNQAGFIIFGTQNPEEF